MGRLDAADLGHGGPGLPSVRGTDDARRRNRGRARGHPHSCPSRPYGTSTTARTSMAGRATAPTRPRPISARRLELHHAALGVFGRRRGDLLLGAEQPGFAPPRQLARDKLVPRRRRLSVLRLRDVHVADHAQRPGLLPLVRGGHARSSRSASHRAVRRPSGRSPGRVPEDSSPAQGHSLKWLRIRGPGKAAFQPRRTPQRR